MNSRTDISDKLIHFTKDSAKGSALDNFLSIFREGVIRGGNGMIKGCYTCVCFTEAPLEALRHSFRLNAQKKYSSYGFMFDKKHIYKLGGRPVYYQPAQEYALLPECLKWRHVTYNPTGKQPIDFTWEREWRLQSNFLEINSNDVELILPIDQDISHVTNELDNMKLRRYGWEAFSSIKKLSQKGPYQSHWRYLTLEE